MLKTFEIDAAHLIVRDLPLQWKEALQVFNDPTHDRLIPQPSHASSRYKTTDNKCCPL